MSIIDIVGFVAGLFFFYLGYLSGPLRWRMAQKASGTIKPVVDIDLIEPEKMRQFASSTRFFSRMSVLFFVLGILACLPITMTLLQENPIQQLSSTFQNPVQSELSNTEQSLLTTADPKVLNEAYKRGLQALKLREYAEAEKGIRQAALGGMSDAQFSLATLYENGLGLPKDVMQACYWYRVAADNKDLDAQKALARLIKYGKDEDERTWAEENC